MMTKWYQMEKKDIPKANLFFIKKIKDELNKKCWSFDSVKGEYVYITTQDYAYCYDVVRLIEKHIANKIWVCKMIYYCKGEKGFYNYTFEMKKR
jgi:hypothetical protein